MTVRDIEWPATWGEAYQCYRHDADMTRIALYVALVELDRALDGPEPPGIAALAVRRASLLIDDLHALVDGMAEVVGNRCV